MCYLFGGNWIFSCLGFTYIQKLIFWAGNEGVVIESTPSILKYKVAHDYPI